METNNKDKKVGIIAYEALGTAFLMYGLMVTKASADAVATLYAVLMYFAWKVSGGHFNPAISVGMYVSEMKLGDNALTLVLMVVSQFIGAFLGLLFGFLALIDKDW